ncbi:MetQ/NlpA family ABC transporter substrate-binding protein [Paenirhodobacter populi]|uniref:MetQ/NlpA family ABC transporter substrate-binding protein n=1 Tax=Paenirhodobacter populi TaxID=2306993 RepID=UPI000FE42D0D|nr:MetQ/NlpA family ABC transporter substrate-binding protein [Sinirhodobacter populi]RWR07921.1 MetQ/NlpA family ABC transporter substrate-binding protein [Sinirhodobacter populi]
MRLPLLTGLGLAILTAFPATALTIGVTPGVLADSVETAATEARAQGLDVKVVEFSDWTTPNLALDNGDLDANYFQHQAFLDNAVKETGYKLVPVGLGVLPNIGLYSEKHAALDQLPEGARIAVASDPVNGGRGLALLQTAGLITLREGVGVKGTPDDIIANPKSFQIIEIEGPQLVRALSDVDLAQGYPAHFVNAGRADIAGKALLYSGVDDTYFAIRFVAREDNKDDPDLARFIRIYQTSPAVREQIHTSYANDPALYTLPWIE